MSTKTTGTINVQTENIFPIIKKFLYSDHEIFLRELVSNAVDATQKLKTLKNVGEQKTAIKEQIEIILDKKNKTLTVRDYGIGMTAEEVEKYINQIAFSGAEEFMKKYEGKSEAIIGHFGLGFYSAFMVAERVELITKSQKANSQAVKWSCDGSPNYELNEVSKKSKGTDVVLHIADDSMEFLEKNRIQEILDKYCKFLPVEIIFGTITESVKDGKDKEGKEKYKSVEVPNVINNTNPAWGQLPKDLKEEDYNNFYRELYPLTFEDPLFHIHLNVDYPFNLTGILYFPKLKNNIEVQKNKINLYSNQVFITDDVSHIVPEFLTLLHGVIDSPDIPLNVSRSYLQSDASVKKISSHITKKVADKLAKMFKDDRKDFETKWDDIRVFIEYGMLTEEKFFEKAQEFMLFKNTKGEYFDTESYRKKISAAQKDKNGKEVILYTHDPVMHHSQITAAEKFGYDVVILDSPLTSHFITRLEQKTPDMVFKRVDADTLSKLIEKEDDMPSKLNEKEQESLKPIFEKLIDAKVYQLQMQAMSEKDAPMVITQTEFMRRMKEQQLTGGGGYMMMGNLPDAYNVVINTNHNMITALLKEKDEKKKEEKAKQMFDLAKLSKGLLKGESLTEFINRSFDLMK